MTGFVFLRVRAHRLLISAALLTVLLTTTVLATLTAFTSAIGDAGLRQTLAHRSAASAALQVHADLKAKDAEAADQAVRAGARTTFDGQPVTVRELVRSGSYALPTDLRQPGTKTSADPDLTLLATLDRSRVALSSGKWPHSDTSTKHGHADAIPVALPETAAARLNVRVGRTITLTDRLDGPPVTVRVTGVYRPKDRGDPYWQLDELGGRGVQTLAFTTYGPLLTDPAAFRAGQLAQTSMAWSATADFSQVSTGQLDSLRKSAERGRAALATSSALGGDAEVTTELPDVLDRIDRVLLVSRSTLLIVALQLVLLAGYALLLVARLLNTERGGETELLAARGGSARRIAGLAAGEAALLALPSAICAPLLTGPLMRLLTAHGPLHRIGLTLDTGTTVWTWLVAFAVAAGCGLAVVAPALLGARGAAVGGARTRAGGLPAPLRAGADIALLLIAAVAYWQLDQQTSDGGSGVLGGGANGSLGVDPVLVAAPALALLAGTVLTLRLLPPISRLAERRAAAGRGLPAALAGWQFSRRPTRAAGPVLLLILAVAMGLFAVGQGASFDRSQNDQADFRAGAPVRVLSSRTPPLGQGGAYQAVPGVASAAPAARASVELSAGRNASLLALDASAARHTLRMRDDLASQPTDRLLNQLSGDQADSSTPVGVPIGGPDTLDLTATLRATGAPHGASPARLVASATATVRDAYGVPYRLRLGGLPADGKAHRLSADIAAAAGAPTGRPAGPLTLTGLELNTSQPAEAERHELVVSRIRATDADGDVRGVSLPEGFHWRGAASGDDPSETADDAERPRADKPGGTAEQPLTLTYRTGRPAEASSRRTAPGITVSASAPHARKQPVTAIATDRFLSSSGAKVGSLIDVPVAGESVHVKIVGSARALPTTGPGQGATDGAAADGAAQRDEKRDGGALLMDFRAVNEALAGDSNTALTPTEWWLRPTAGATDTMVTALRERPDTDPNQVLVRSELADELHDDPLGAGPQAGLIAAAAVAAALAAVGFAVSAAGSLRERAAEFAVLRALGTPRRQLARTVAVEQTVLIALALGVGTLLGWVLTRAVVPLIVLTGEGTPPIPTVIVNLPGAGIAAVLAAVAAIPLLITAAVAARREDPVVALRHQGGE